jgi:hypothetical protein
MLLCSRKQIYKIQLQQAKLNPISRLVEDIHKYSTRGAEINCFIFESLSTLRI